MKTKIQNAGQYKPAEKILMKRVSVCNAPIAVAFNQVGQARVYQACGSKNSPKKQFIDLRCGNRISLGQAQQIVAKYEG